MVAALVRSDTRQRRNKFRVWTPASYTQTQSRKLRETAPCQGSTIFARAAYTTIRPIPTSSPPPVHVPSTSPVRCPSTKMAGLWAKATSLRSTGKSHSMAAAVHVAVRAGIKRIHLSAPTAADFHDVNLEGKSGILATCGRDPRPRWVSSERRLEWPNAAVCVFFSGEEPESLRGPQCE